MIEKAKKDYLEGMKYKDLAEKYGVSINTVKSWVKRYSWAKLKKGTKGCTQNKENVGKGAHKEKVQESAVKITEEVVKDIDKKIVESNTTLTKYDTNVKERLLEVEAWARDGLIDEQIAHNLGIALSTFYEYKKKHPEFSESLRKGKEVVDIEVENALLQKALGIKETVKRAIKVKEVIYDQGKRVKETERIEYADEEVYVPPETKAQIFWLKNRKSTTWRDKQEITHEGDMNINTPYQELTTDELKELIKIGEDQVAVELKSEHIPE